MDVEIREAPARRVAYLRGLGRYPEVFPELWPRFSKIAAPLGLLGRGAAMSIMHDRMGAVPAEQLRGDAAIEVGPDWHPQGGLNVETVPAGPFAVTQHRGPYQLLGTTWGDLLGKWVPASGCRIRAAPMYEIYLNDPRTTSEPDLITELYLAVEKA